MISLKASWQEQQKQRQQEVAQRQQQVHQILVAFQRDRQLKATQLRDDLSLFQLELQQETQKFLTQTHQQRQARAQALAQQLQDFAQLLKAETANFMSITADERSLMAQQLWQELNTFHAELNQSVASLRHRLQMQVHYIQGETQSLLKNSHSHRMQVHQQLVQDLAAYMQSLHTEVSTYLTELELMRQERAQQLRQMLQHDRDRRTAELNSLFEQLAEFRAELAHYCADLKGIVWGSSTPAVDAAMPSQPVVATPSPKVAAPIIETPESLFAMAQLPATEKNESAATAHPKLSVKDAEQIEDEIYYYLHQSQGARLTEIESALTINRFQVVDALRALIKKGLITQRDRVYLVQEEA